MWLCMRLVQAGWATLGECKTVLTLLDVLEANEALDAIEEAEAEAAKKR